MDAAILIYQNSILKESKEHYRNDRRKAVQLDKIMKKLFMLNNKRPIIDFLNAIYGDDIPVDAEVKYKNKEIVTNPSLDTAVLLSYHCDMFIEVKTGDRTFEYMIEFQTRDDRQIAVRLFRYSFELKVQSIDFSQNEIVIDMPEPYVIVLEESSNVPDKHSVLIRFKDGRSFTYDCKVLKFWDYNLDELFTGNMYLLLPLKIFDIRRKIHKLGLEDENIGNDVELKKQIKNDIFKVVEQVVSHIDKAFEEAKITIEDYNEFNIVLENLSDYMNHKLDRTGEIEKGVSQLVKTFYDKRVEERGFEKGIEKERAETREFVKNLLRNGVSKEAILLSCKMSKEEVDSLIMEIRN